MTETTGTEINEVMDNHFKYSKDDILQICNVSDTTFDRFIAVSPSSAMGAIAERDYIIVGPRNKHYYNESVL